MRSGNGGRSGVVAGTVMVLLAVCLAGVAGAQQEEEKRRTTVLEPVTVTAQKQEETEQETPVAMTVLSDTALEDRMVENLPDLTHFVPNMTSFQTNALGENVVTMRGITASPISRNTSIAMYIDGAPVLSSFGYASGLLNVERVEVLRGPQGTLWGKSTQSGVVSIVTAKPTNQFKGKAIGEGGLLLSSTDSGHSRLTGLASMALSGPVVKDKLFFSVAGRGDHKNGFIDNPVTNRPEYEPSNFYGDGKLRWTPTQDLDVSFTYSRDALRLKGLNANTADAANRVVQSNLVSWQNADIDLQALNIGYTINDNLKLTSISARRNGKLRGELDLDFSDVTYVHPAINSEKTTLSEELRLNGTYGAWDWLLGGYLDWDKLDYNYRINSIYPAYQTRLSTKLQGNCYAAFAHVGYKITPKLKLLGGLRYEYQQLKFDSSILPGQQSEGWTNLSPKFGLEYNFTPEIMGYATVAQGYRPGGFNQSSIDPKYYKYDPETLWSYEIGFKNTLFDKRLMANIAFFYMDISSAQVEESVSLVEEYLTNAGRAKSMGVELDMTAVVTEGLTLNGGFGYTDAQFTSFSDSAGDYKGNKLPYAPEYTVNIGAQYRAQNGFYVRGDVVGYGKTYFDKKNTGYRDPYALVNAKIGFERDRYDIYVYGKNIFDCRHDIKKWNGMDVYSDPGEMGVQVVFRF